MSGSNSVMQKTEVKLREASTPIQPLLALGGFGRYDIKEGRTRVGIPKVREDKVLTKLHKAFVEFLTYTWGQALEDSEKSGSNSVDEERYQKASSLIRDLQYSSEDIQGFGLELGEYQDHKNFAKIAGIFLSALMNIGEEREYIVHTAYLSKPIEFLGYRNIKNITVKGEVGDGLGYRMKRGIIIVEGNADSRIGLRMRGGEIHLNGDYINIPISDIDGGEIYHKGVLIFNKGTKH